MATRETREARQQEQIPIREAKRKQENQWRAYCPVHNCSIATTTEGEAKHCRNIHNDGCEERASRVERILDGTTERVCVDCGYVTEQRFGFVDGRVWRCLVHGEPADERSGVESEGGDADE